MKAELERIGRDYVEAMKEPVSGHPIARFVRAQAADAVKAAIGATFPHFLVIGSPGKGQWTIVPWIAVFDPAVTESAMRGFYVVYLFGLASKTVYLSLNQGTTAVRQEFKKNTTQILRDRAHLMRAHLADGISRFSAAPIELDADGILASDYEAGHAIGIAYDLENLPDESVLRGDLIDLVKQYGDSSTKVGSTRRLTKRSSRRKRVSGPKQRRSKSL